MKFPTALCWLMVFVLTGCDKGINPSPTPTAPPAAIPTGWMAGVIRYQHWPPVDSLYNLRLVAFRNFPPGNIINEYVAGNAFVYPPVDQPALPFLVDSLSYTFALAAADYQYVVIAQQFGPDILSQWRAVGQYDLDSNLAVPSTVTIVQDDTTHDINISVDFSHPPPPPPLLQ